MGLKKTFKIFYISALLTIGFSSLSYAFNSGKTEEIGGVVFNIPDYFDTRETNYDNYYDVAYYPKTTKAKATLGLKILKSGVTSKAVMESKDNIVNNWKKSYSDIKIDEKTIKGNYILIGKPKINGGEIKVATIANDYTKELIFVIITVDNDDVTTNKYIKDFDTMIDNISFKNSKDSNISASGGFSGNNSSTRNNSLPKDIGNSINDYKDSIDQAKSNLNTEIDKAADELKGNLGIYGKAMDGYIDDYVDIYKDIIDKSADIYKDTADSYGELYKDILGKYGW